MNLRTKTIQGLTWSSISQIIKQLSQFVVTAVLARLLSPEDFGLLGMAVVFTSFVSIFSEMGVSGALIHKQDAQERHYSSAFWLNVAVGVMLTLGLIACSSWIAQFYRKAELQPVLVALSFNFFLSSFTIIQQAILSKDMDFRSLMIRDVAAVMISGLVGILYAYQGAGVWSLVIQLLTFTIVNNVMLWGCSAWRPKWIFSIAAIKEIFSFSANVTGFQVVNHFARNMDNLLIGRILGAQPLGFYTLAYKLMMFPLQNFTWVISRVMFPAFAKIQHDLEKVRQNYLKMVKMVALISFPCMTYLWIAAPDVIRLVYGDRWIDVVGLVQIFCFCGMAQSITSLGGIIYLGQGRADVQLKMIVVSTLLLTTALFLAVPYGIKTVALTYTVFYLLWTQVSLFIVARLISLKLWQIYKAMAVPFFISMAFLLGSANVYGMASGQPLLKMTVLGIVGFFIYGLSIVLLKQITWPVHWGRLIYACRS